MDVKTIFLNDELEEEIYMSQPKAFVELGKEKKVCKLVKSLYGLIKLFFHMVFKSIIVINGVCETI